MAAELHVEGPIRANGAHSVGQQTHGVVLLQVVELDRRRQVGSSRRGEWRDGHHGFAGYGQRCAAGREQAQLGTRLQQSFGEPRAGGDEMLTVVEHEQERARAKVPDQCVRQRRTAAGAHRQDRRERRFDQRSVGEWCQVNEAHVGRRLARRTPQRLDRQAGLAAATGTDQAHEAVLGQQ